MKPQKLASTVTINDTFGEAIRQPALYSVWLASPCALRFWNPLVCAIQQESVLDRAWYRFPCSCDTATPASMTWPRRASVQPDQVALTRLCPDA